MVRAFTAADLLTIWERGAWRNSGGRGLAILSVACPELDPNVLAGLTVGRRDALLLDARELAFGSELAATARCPACDEALEFTARTSDLRLPDEAQAAEAPADAPAEAARASFHWSRPGSQVTFRLPTAGDLDAIGDIPGVAEAERALLVRCVLAASLDGAAVASAVAAAALPEDVAAEVIAAIGSAAAANDPQAEILLNLACPACGHGWQAPFDIAGFFWAEIASQARRLLREVDTLARAYGWREADILALTATRRQGYIEMVQG